MAAYQPIREVILVEKVNLSAKFISVIVGKKRMSTDKLKKSAETAFTITGNALLPSKLYNTTSCRVK